MATPVAPGIITFGLGGNHSNLIIGFPFNLGFEVIVGSPFPQPPSGTTHRPGGTGGTAERPWEDDTYWPDQTEDEEDLWRTVTVRVKFKGKVTEKMYIVREERAKVIIKIIKIINMSKARIKVAVKGLKNKWTQTVATVKNLRTKKD